MKRILFRLLLLSLGVTVPLAAFYYAPLLKTEWDILAGKQGFQRRDFQIAVEHLTPAIEALEQRGYVERSTFYRRIVTQSHLALLRTDDALAHFRSLIQSQRADSKAYFALGLHALKANDWDGSIRHLKRTVELEPGCVVCAAALKNAEAVKASHHGGVEARLAQGKALELMKPPAICLSYLAVVTAGSTLSSGVLHPKLVALAGKFGATKQVAESAMGLLASQLSPTIGRLTTLMTGDLCPPPTTNENIRWFVDLVELVPFGSQTHRASIAGVQALELSRLTGTYGLAFNAELGSNQQLATADILRAAHWDILTTASKDPKFIERDLMSLVMPASSPPRGWMARTLDAINPFKWF